MEFLISNLAGASLIASGICLGVWLTGGQKLKQERLTLYCGAVKVDSTDNEYVFHAEPCNNLASVIIGGRSLCEDHFEVYIAEMTGTVER